MRKTADDNMGKERISGTANRRSAIKIMGSLIGLVKPLMHIMAAAILLGTAGYLCAIFLTIFAGYALMES